MPKFPEHMDGEEVICPYCKHSYQPESEDFTEDAWEQECEECGKFFYTHQSFIVYHHAIPDCELNGQVHDYQLVNLRDGKSHPFCTVCGKCKPL